MGKTFRWLFNLHPGEGRKASLFIILGLLWSVGSYGSFVLSEGMFLERVGALGLPKIYFVIAVAMCLLSAALLFAIHHLTLHSLLISIISLWICVNAIFFIVFPLYHHTAIYWYLYKAVGWIIPISTYIVYWAFADQYYDLQDGKRFFCLFNSMTFLGDALGGAVIVYFLDFLGVRCIMLLFMGTLLAALPFIFLITRTYAPLADDVSEKSYASIDLKNACKTIFRSKFTLYLISFYFVMQLLALITEFNYMQNYEKTFSQAPAHSLTEFNGKVGMWISFGNLFFGLLVYSRLVKKTGVNNIILIAPSFFLALFSIWFYKDILSIAILGMVAREGMVYSFDDNNLNLLIAGVPTKIKNQIRIAVESFIEPSGMFAAASMLYLFQENAHFLGLTLSICALIIVLLLRSSYPRAIFCNLVATSMRFDKKAKDYLKEFSKKEIKQTELLLLSQLKLSGEKNQLIAFEYLLKMGTPKIVPRLLDHIGKLTLPGKLKAIELFSESKWAKEPIVLEKLKRWRYIFPHPAIRSSIHFYLARHGLLRPERILHDLHSEHLGLKSAAILAIKTSPHTHHLPSFRVTASEKLRELLTSEQDSEVSMGLQILGLEKNPENAELIFSYLKHPSLIVNRSAMKALSLIAHPHCKESIDGRLIIMHLNRTQDSELRSYCLQTLEKIADIKMVRPLILASFHCRLTEHKYVERVLLGIAENTAPILIQIIQDRRVADKCRLLAGKILGKIDKKAVQKSVFGIVKSEIKRAYFYFYHAHAIQSQIPEQDLSVLHKALLASYQSIIDFIIQLLGIAGSLEECEVLSYTLRHHNRKIRAQAVESLEKSCDAKLFALLKPLIDEKAPDEKMRVYLKEGGIPLNLTQLLDRMTHSSSRADQIVALALKAQLKTPDWRFTLREKLQSHEEIFHHFASELLEQHA